MESILPNFAFLCFPIFAVKLSHFVTLQLNKLLWNSKAKKQKQRKILFYEEKSLVGLTHGLHLRNPWLWYFEYAWRFFLYIGCFVCVTCRGPFTDGNFFEHEGRPYCETHFHALRGSLCAGCDKPISGRCITAMFRKFHPEHFVCSFCLKQLNKGTFKEQGEKPYCHECYDRLFG